MKSTEIKLEIKMLQIELRMKIKKMTVKKAAEVSGLNIQDLYRWLHKPETWSYKRLLKIAKKFNL